MAERTITVEREVIEQASLAVRETAKALITLEETLKQPYPDDPRWSPWTRFIDRNEYSPWSLLAKADTALKAALSSDATDQPPAPRGLSEGERPEQGEAAHEGIVPPGAVYVGCAFPSIMIHRRRKGDRRGRYQARCSCGWTGPRRRTLSSALDDRDQHLASTDQPTTFPANAEQGCGGMADLEEGERDGE